MQAGGWSLTWQGDQTKTSDYPNADTLLVGDAQDRSGAGQVDYSPDGTGVDVQPLQRDRHGRGREALRRRRGRHHLPGHACATPAAIRRISRRSSGSAARACRSSPCFFPAGRSRRTTSSTAPTRSSPPGCRAPKGWGSPTCCLPAPTAARVYDFTGRLSFDWPAGDCLPQAGRDPVPPRLRPFARQPIDGSARLPESPPVMACPAESR